MISASKDQQLTVNPNPLEVHADKVDFEMSALLPVKMMKKGKVYTLETYYVYGNQEIQLESVEFRADDYPNSGEEQPRQSQTYSFDFASGMESGSLQVRGVASDPRNGKSKESERLTVAPGLITTSQLVQNSYYAAYADHGYNNQEELIPTNINFYFDQGRSYLRAALATDGKSNRDKQQEMAAFIADKNVTRTVTITGTHSPEGPERVNSKLSEDRAKVIEDYYARQMRKYDYKGMAESIDFILKPVIEDWNAFKEALSGYDGISSDQKSEYLNIVNGSGTFEEKEDALQKLSTYRQVFRDIYPGLRSAQTEILTVKEKKTDNEILVLSQQITKNQVNADTLSLEELMYGATLTPSLDEKEAIYMAATKKGGTAASHNNLAAVYVAKGIETGDASFAEKAIAQADIAKQTEEIPEAYVNLASAYLMQGNREAASDAINRAVELGVSGDLARGANGILGMTQIATASYETAVGTLSSSEETADNMFNKGLAQLLNKDYENAISSFDDCLAADGDYALASYGAAIASARLGNNSDAISHISDAVSKDPSLKEKALNDLEFAAIASDQAFRAALQ
jgi:tetratricopeptide (TPR) repeat protein